MSQFQEGDTPFGSGLRATPKPAAVPTPAAIDLLLVQILQELHEALHRLRSGVAELHRLQERMAQAADPRVSHTHENPPAPHS